MVDEQIALAIEGGSVERGMDIDGEWYVYLGDEAVEMVLTIAGDAADLDGKKGAVALVGDKLTVTFEPNEAYDNTVSHSWIIATARGDGFQGIYRYDLQGPGGTQLLGSDGPVDEALTMKRATGQDL